MMFLAPDQLSALTGKLRAAAQRRALDRMGIRYLLSATGRPVVLVEEVERLGLGTPRQRSGKNQSPRLDLVA